MKGLELVGGEGFPWKRWSGIEAVGDWNGG